MRAISTGKIPDGNVYCYKPDIDMATSSLLPQGFSEVSVRLRKEISIIGFCTQHGHFTTSPKQSSRMLRWVLVPLHYLQPVAGQHELLSLLGRLSFPHAWYEPEMKLLLNSPFQRHMPAASEPRYWCWRHWVMSAGPMSDEGSRWLWAFSFLYLWLLFDDLIFDIHFLMLY